ncbi:MAG TPA: DUF6150 family protein [Tenuifilaceae bacterium]|nr:DUF6150 family protein [Tenuifilaceae bacterium]HPI45600.1 DUF6150 family protein [Tenuifilaceae bacterium]HPN22405.1 DUF6150 family protein [Tenuifilaceae bacterium]HPV55904.1 DUF6150 family protein [Tenuifilaceae bacterium]
MPRIIKIFLVIVVIATAQQGYAQKFFEAETIEQAKLKIFHVEDPADADLHFCIVYEEKEITKVGIMMEVEEPKMAQITLIFVDDPAQADLKVWLVETPAEVKWQNESKKKFLKIEGLNY